MCIIAPAVHYGSTRLRLCRCRQCNSCIRTNWPIGHTGNSKTCRQWCYIEHYRFIVGTLQGSSITHIIVCGCSYRIGCISYRRSNIVRIGFTIAPYILLNRHRRSCIKRERLAFAYMRVVTRRYSNIRQAVDRNSFLIPASTMSIIGGKLYGYSIWKRTCNGIMCLRARRRIK